MSDTRPEWMPKPACRVILICGPAGAGKTTWALEQAGINDTVIDLDECFIEACGVHGHNADPMYLSAAIAIRNCRLATLSLKDEGTAYLIISAPKRSDREWWIAKLGADLRMITASVDEIRSRGVGSERVSFASAGWEAFDLDQVAGILRDMVEAG